MAVTSNITRSWEYQIKKAITDWGRTCYIVYGSANSCNSCSLDPIKKESTNPFCSTCSGKYYYNTENTLEVKGVVRSYVGDSKFVDYNLFKFGYMPDHDARLSCMLEDVLLNTDSCYGSTYLDKDKNIRIIVDGTKYNVVNTSRTGIEDAKLIMATMKQVK
jgi:hypothetical protein